MKTNILRYVALTVGLSAGTAYAQYTNYGYTPPPPGYGTQPVAPQQNAVPIHPSLMVQNNQQAYRQPTMPSPQYPVGAVGTQVQMPPQNYAPQPAYVPQVGYNSYSTPRALPALNNRVAMNDDLLNGGATYGQPLPAPQPTPAPQYQPAPQGMPYQGTAPVPNRCLRVIPVAQAAAMVVSAPTRKRRCRLAGKAALAIHADQRRHNGRTGRASQLVR